jgi:hypothetical protein
MDSVPIRVVVTAAGLWLLFVVLRSIIRVALMNQHRRDGVASAVGHLVRACFGVCIPADRDYAARQRVLFWFFPTYILLLIVVYFVVTMTGFACLYWSAQAVPGWHEAFIASGSALNTLGFATPPGSAGQWLAIPEGAIGLGIVVFLFTFIPGYQAVVMSREDRTAWLYARAGERPTGAALLEWSQRAGISGDLTGTWEASESWFRTLADTHSISPMLTLAPSVQSGQSWVVAAAAVLDAVSLAASTLDAPGKEAAKICAATGTRALRMIARALGWQGTGEVAASVTASRAAFDASCAQLAAAGLRLRADREGSWRDYAALRSGYREALAFIAVRTFVPLDAQ